MEESPLREKQTSCDDDKMFSESSELLMDLQQISVLALPTNNENNIDMNNASNANLSKVTGAHADSSLRLDCSKNDYNSINTPNWNIKGNDSVNGFANQAAL